MAYADDGYPWYPEAGDINVEGLWLGATFHIFPTKRLSVAMPKLRVNTITIPGAMGVLDNSSALTGYPIYENRTGTWEFTVINEYDAYDWNKIYTNLCNLIHGKKVVVYLWGQNDFRYRGRLTIDNWNVGKNWSTISISYDLEPYKYEVNHPVISYEVSPFYKRKLVTLSPGKDIFPTDYSNGGFPIAHYLDTMPVHPIITARHSTASTVELRFINEELNIDMTQKFPIGINTAYRFTMTNIKGNVGNTAIDKENTLYFNKMRLIAVSDGQITMDWENGRL